METHTNDSIFKRIYYEIEGGVSLFIFCGYPLPSEGSGGVTVFAADVWASLYYFYLVLSSCVGAWPFGVR